MTRLYDFPDVAMFMQSNILKVVMNYHLKFICYLNVIAHENKPYLNV